MSATEQKISSISLYVGIPTQGFRSVQAEIAGLVGQVMKIALVRDARQDPITYSPFVKGASSYVSVFGYWMESRKGSRRVDDHTEVIEFLFQTDEIGPMSAVVLSEIALPAMFCAAQQEVLAVVRHDGDQRLVRLVRAPEWRVKESRPTSYESFGPKDILGLLTQVCWARWIPPESPEDPKRLSHAICSLFRTWCDKVTTKAACFPESVDVQYLPIVWQRLLTAGVTWWALFDLGIPRKSLEDGVIGEQTEAKKNLARTFGPPSDEQYPSTDGLLKRVRALIAPNVTAGVPPRKNFPSEGEHLYPVLVELELDYLRKDWFGKLKQTLEILDLHGEDPLVNAFLWLAYSGDYLAWYLHGDAETGKLLDGESVSRVNRFPEVASAFGQEWNDTARPNDWNFWKSRLDLLARVNDEAYPDEPFLSAWRLVARLLPHPWTRAQSRIYAENDHPLSEKPDGRDLNWWTDTGKRWNQASPATRMWLSPLVIRRVHDWLRCHSDLSKPYKDFLGNWTPRSGQTLSDLLAELEKSLQLDPLKMLIDAARQGFPTQLRKLQRDERDNDFATFIRILLEER
jgi:hypothetical protein